MLHHILRRCSPVAIAATLTLSGSAVLRAGIKGPPPGDKLYRAAESGSVLEIEKLLKNGTAVDARNSQGRTALMAAVNARHREATKLLIDRGADVNTQSRNETGTHVLTWAALAGDEAIVKLLLEKGAKTEVRAHNGLSPLGGAVNKALVEMVRLLLENGADPNFPAARYTPKEISQARLIPALLLAAHNGTKEIVSLLLDKGVRIETADSFSDDALMYAARGGRLEVVELLLKRGANAKHAGREGHTALVYAAYNGHKSIAVLLLDAGADPHAIVEEVHKDGRRSRFDAQWAAVQEGHNDLAELIRRAQSRAKPAPKKGEGP